MLRAHNRDQDINEVPSSLLPIKCGGLKGTQVQLFIALLVPSFQWLYFKSERHLASEINNTNIVYVELFALNTPFEFKHGTREIVVLLL